MKKSLFMVFLVLMGSCQNGDRAKLNDGITYEIYGDSNVGFGYKIMVSGKLLIDQSQIPAVGGMQTFKNEMQAVAVAELVVLKIRSSDGPPSVSIEELDSLKIDYLKK